MFSNNDTYQSNSFIANGAGVAVMYSNKVSMLANNFKENWCGGCPHRAPTRSCPRQANH